MQKILTTIALVIIGFHLNAQSLEIGGRIIDSKGEPIPGVNILVKGTPNGVVSNAKGYFNITLPYGSHILVYSFFGYKSVEQKIHVTPEFPWDLEVSLVTKGSKEKGSAKFVEMREEVDE